MLGIGDFYLEELTLGAVIVIAGVALLVAWRGINLHHHFDDDESVEHPDDGEL